VGVRRFDKRLKEDTVENLEEERQGLVAQDAILSDRLVRQRVAVLGMSAYYKSNGQKIGCY